ncbi:hypothetical protein B0H11DRAFT_1218586 [Mycena galericulata]|nr:hypothetical protein B0H11DRAFT_1218586 [Mycena galericulata]
MHNQKTRQITLTRYTTLYFFLALLSCFSLVIVQSKAYASNTEGASAVASFLAQSGVNTTSVGISFLDDGNVQLCQNIPGQIGSDCTTIVDRAHGHMTVRDMAFSFDERADEDKCAVSLLWLGDVLSDARREDLVILVFQLWLLALSVVTLLNESLPHLFASLAARAMATGWAGFRVRGNINLQNTYDLVIQTGPCNGFDPMADWWDANTTNGIVGLVANVLIFVMMAALSYKLYKVYASETFARVGASKDINRVYKLVLLFSVILQLASFFTLAGTAMWLGKISFGAIRSLAEHFPIYLAALVVTAFFEIPWLVLGWISVRREAKTLFLLFSLISLILLAMATGMFVSPLYRFVLVEWSFFATISCAAYALLVVTFVLAVVCRLQFGKGLAHFLRVCTDLEAEDFTPVSFPKGDDPMAYDDKDEKKWIDSEIPVLRYSSEKGQKQVPPTHERKVSRISLFFANSKSTSETIKLSSTPDLFRSAMEVKTPAPIIVKPVARTSSSASSVVRPMGRAHRPPNIYTGANSPELPPMTFSPLYKHTRAESAGERSSRGRAPAAEPVIPAQAALRSRSVPRRGGPGGVGLPRRPTAKEEGKRF